MPNKHKLNLIQWNGIERMEWYGLDLSSCLGILESFEVKRDLENSDLKEKNHDSVAVTLSPVENWKFNVFLCLESGCFSLSASSFPFWLPNR